MERRVSGRVGLLFAVVVVVATVIALVGPCGEQSVPDLVESEAAIDTDAPVVAMEIDDRRRRTGTEPEVSVDSPVDIDGIVARHRLRVIRTDGSAVPGARLALHVEWLRFAESDKFPESPPPEWTGATDGSGRATIPLATWERAMVVVSAPGIASVARRLQASEDGREQTIVIPDPLAVELRFVAPDGEALRDLIVELAPLAATQRGDASSYATLPGPVISGTTDATGAVRLDGLESGWRDLSVRLPGASRLPIGRLQLPVDSPVTYVVPVACIVYGQVTERGSGRPIANARVTLIGSGHRGGEFVLADVHSDRLGHYTARVLGASAYIDHALVRASGHAIAITDPARAWAVGHRLQSAARVQLDLQAVPAATVKGSLRSAGPLPLGCVVSARPAPGDEGQLAPLRLGLARVDAGGGFEIQGVPIGSTIITVLPPLAGSLPMRDTGAAVRYLDRHAAHDRLAERSVDVPVEGVSVILDVPARSAPRQIEGTVRDADRRPVVGAVVTTVHTSALERRASSRTDSGGSFALDLPNAPRTVELSIEAPGFVRGVYPLDENEMAVGEPIEVALERAARVTGRVVDESGQPVRGTRLLIVDGAHIDAGRKASGHTDVDGRFDLPLDAPAEGLYVMVDAPGAAKLWTRLPPIDERNPTEIATIEVGTIRLGPGRTIRGEVVDRETGAPVPDALVGWFVLDERQGTKDWKQDVDRVHEERDGMPCRTVADRQGAFVLRNVPEGNILLVVVAREHSLALQGVPDDDETVRIDLRRLRTVHGRVRRSDGESLRGVVVRLQSEGDGGNDTWEPLDDSGHFRFEEVSTAACRLKIWGDPDRGQNLLPVVVEVPKRHEEPLDIVIQAGHELTGVVADAKGSPLADVQIEARSRTEPWSEAWAETDAQGRFRLASLDGSKHVLVAHTPTRAPSWLTDVTPGGDPVELVLHEGAEITGVVLSPDGTGIPNVSVEAQMSLAPGDPRSVVPVERRATTDRDGAFVIRGLADLPHRIRGKETIWHQEHGAFTAPPPAVHRPGESVRLVYTRDEE